MLNLTVLLSWLLYSLLLFLAYCMSMLSRLTRLRPLRIDRVIQRLQGIVEIEWDKLKLPFVEKPTPGYHYYSTLFPKNLGEVALHCIWAVALHKVANGHSVQVASAAQNLVASGWAIGW